MTLRGRPRSAPKIAIIGGGTAGMGCALWLKNMALIPVIIESSATLGGQARAIHRVNRWFLGHPGRTSRELAELFSRHVRDVDITIMLASQITALRCNGPASIDLRLENGNQTPRRLRVNAVVVATGTKVKSYEIFRHAAGVDTLQESGRARFFPTDHLDILDQLAATEIAVVGGGDNAHFTTMDIAPYASHAHLIMRSDPRAQQKIRSDVCHLIQQGRVTEHRHASISAFSRRDEKIEITITHGAAKKTIIAVDWLFVRAGFAPVLKSLEHLELLQGLCTDSAGFITTDAETRTSIPWVYAIGDVTGLMPRSLITAAAHGAVAARAIEQDLRSIDCS